MRPPLLLGIGFSPRRFCSASRRCFSSQFPHWSSATASRKRRANREVGTLASEPDGKAAALGSLAALYPWMRPFHARPVCDYASRLFDPPASRTQPEFRIQALHKLLALIRKAAIRNGIPDGTAGEMCRDFEQRRVLQTGPHLLLIPEPEAFYTHIFSLLGLSSHGCSSYVSYAVSTVSLVERARKGPGWLSIGGKAINVFGLSRSRMIGYGLLTGLGPYQFDLMPAGADGQSEALQELRDLLPTAQFERPAHAIKAANQVLWPAMFCKRCTFLQLDDEDIADLVADHLADDASWLRTRLLENQKVASGLVEGIDHLATGPWAGWLARGTDFFWSYENGKRVPLRLEGRKLVRHPTGAKVVRFTASEIAARLLDRSLIPNMLLAFLVLAMLPGVRVLGGVRQPIYYPLMRYIVCRAVEIAGIDHDLRHALAVDDLPGAWGHRVIEGSRHPFDLLTEAGSSGISDMIDVLAQVTLTEACGNMAGFVSDPAWSELRKRIEAKAVSVTDPEWAFT
ncbi:hypothetical protein [Mesorhizobium retamae]|uniref:Uncharacterized protein n=1 Tax=Mesorhizobium retamae TaxID=2912854 RepID=A0ABS9QP99_9HYPH|nr:hypothetical protein [Mesorhizobium sp. IRAMC:0171]MCG7508633.1 hypothetical protein [Mesorhizobium sp. IRAMC:0171]